MPKNTAADKYFANQNPIGQGLHVGNGNKNFFDIVGVVGNVHYAGLDAVPAPTMYVPITQDGKVVDSLGGMSFDLEDNDAR